MRRQGNSVLACNRSGLAHRLIVLLCVCFLFSANSFAQISEAGNLSKMFEAHPLNLEHGRNCIVSLCCVFKNEAEWLREWIEYHKLIGIHHFYLYNNFSTDNYLDVLTPYLLAGEVEIFEFPKAHFESTDQKNIYNHALQLALGHNQWLTAIDTDEFILPWETKNLIAYLDRFSPEVGNIEINWQTFGTSRVKKLRAGELLIEKLLLRAPVDATVNKWYKSIARPEAVIEWINAHACSLKPGYASVRVTPCNEGGTPVDETAVSHVRIHHYVWRTENFFYQVKLPRIYQWNANFFQTTSPHDYLKMTNSVLDVSMLYFVPALKNALFGQATESLSAELKK